MVRETRHLWVGNLPDNIRDDRIREHFKRYGRVQNVKLLGRAESASAGVGATGASGVCATVAFMDIKSASKAHNAEHVLDERTLTTEYYEPAAIPPTAGAPSAGSSPAGSGYSGSSSSVNSVPAPSSASRYHLSGGEDSSGATTCPIAASAAAPATWRGTNDSATEYCRRGNTPAAYGRYQRNNSTAPYSTPPSNLERSTPHHRWYAAGGESTPSTPGGGTESGRRRRLSGSASSRSDSSSPEPSDTSRASTPAAQPPLAHHNNHRTPSALAHQWASTANGRPLSICVRNLPTRSTDSSLKDGLYHEYKKHGKVVWVKVVGQNADRYAVVRFKKPSDVEKALEVSQDKLFFGCKISVAPHQSCDDDADSTKPYETDIDEYHPKATRTLFIGNLEKDVTQQQLRDKFKHFGRIIEIDIKKGSGGGAGYAFCQYASISSVVEAIRAMDGEYVGGSRVKLGFGKPVATACVWVDGLTEHTEKQEAFYEQLEKHGGSAALAGSERLSGEVSARYVPSARHETIRYEGCGSRSRASSYGRSSSRTPRYSALEHYDPVDYAADRRYRVYDETGASSPLEDSPFEDRLQSVVVSPHRARRHCRDSSAEDRKHSKERRRSAGGSARRSRSGSAGRERHAARRKHRRRHDGSGSRAGTPLRDEPDAPPAEPRRPPRDRPPLPMCLPLPKFAAQLLRSAPPAPRAAPQPAPAPDSPPRPPSVSSSSGGSAPHSPSLEERIRSLDEKYEKWSGSRAVTDAPDRSRLRHRLLEVDINEVKPSEVVSALLAKRSVFDEDTERLECVVRPPSPPAPRVPRFPPLPAHPQPPPAAYGASHHPTPDQDSSDRPSDPRLNRPERPCRLEKLGKINESDYGECRLRPRTPSTDRSQPDSCDRRTPPEMVDGDAESRSRDSATGTCDAESKSSFDTDDKEIELGIKRERSNSSTSDSLLTGKSESIGANILLQNASDRSAENKRPDSSQHFHLDQKCARDVIDMIIKKVESGQNLEPQIDMPCKVTNESKFEFFKQGEPCPLLDSETKTAICEKTKKSENNKIQMFTQSLANKDPVEYELHLHHKNVSSSKNNKEKDVINPDTNKCSDKNDKEKYNHNISQVYQITKLEKENIQIEKQLENEKQSSNSDSPADKKFLDIEKNVEDRVVRNDRDKVKHNKERLIKEKHDCDKEKLKNNRNEKHVEKTEKDKKLKGDSSVERNHIDKSKVDKDAEKLHKEKTETDKSRNLEEKSRHEHHKKDKHEKDKRKESDFDSLHSKQKKDERHKSEKLKKDVDTKRENKKETEPIKSRKSSRDESLKEISRKDSTDSSTSRASHESSKSKDLDNHHDIKEDLKPRIKLTDLFFKLEMDKEPSHTKDSKFEHSVIKIKSEIKEEKFAVGTMAEPHIKPKAEIIEKHRHHSLDSPSVDSKRKERLNSCSSLPSNIGHKRRISSHDSFDSVCDEAKKNKNESRLPERRDSKDSRSGDKHKTTKFSKGHFAKIIESKTKDDKKGQVKPPDAAALLEFREVNDTKNSSIKVPKKPSKEDSNENIIEHTEESHNTLDFLALFELRSSEEDERQKALRKEMKEKKRIQQLQQIQELQMQQDAMQQGELLGKLKDDKKQKSEDKKKESAREKRFSVDRKSRDDKIDNSKKKNRKLVQSSDTSDSDEPKKHSIFDIIDDGPTYISMYDKVKARSCKNMQKQEEEKRQEKIKAKFSQLKQSRAKREEKKRSSWDEDSDSENEVRKTRKSSLDNSSDEENGQDKKRDKLHMSNIDFDENKTEDYFSTPNDDDLRNKLARKNSRSRIISDSSGDDTSKSKSPAYHNVAKKFNMSDFESLTTGKIDGGKDLDDQIKKSSLLHLFGKSDSDDSKLKSSIDNNSTYKLPSFKTMCNDLSSESESVTSNRNAGEFRRKHKKKPKKYKSTYSDEENKINHSDSGGVADSEIRQKISEKQRRHSSKKDKRREKNRESIDTDEGGRDDKLKLRREKRSPDNTTAFEYGSDVVSNITKRDGKMEDIFGPLSDESDKDTTEPQNKSEFPCHDFDSLKDRFNSTEIKLKEQDDVKRKKEKKRKEKRWLREDDNSLDMDAVSKAIEARLFAETFTDDDTRIRMEASDENMRRENNDNSKYMNSNLLNEVVKLNNKHDKMRRDSREKKKKKKRNKEERQNRKEQHPFYHTECFDKSDNEITERPILDTVINTMLLDIPLPNDSQMVDEKIDDGKSLEESPSLPRLTESPPILIQSIHDEAKTGALNTSSNIISENINNIYLESKVIEIEQIPMPPPFENIVQDISEVPLPTDPEPASLNAVKSDNFIATLSSDSDLSEDAVQSLSVLEDDIDKTVNIEATLDKLDKIDVPPSKLEKKAEEKPRAIISQEETEDAVAALLGESFGGKINTFSNYEETENNAAHQNDIESTSLSTANIPEEDAEEMRQAVQNLNACEMELKPDTPVSDNDLLLIDTDNEEADETPQDSSERLPVNIVAPQVPPTNNSEQSKPTEEPQIQVSIPKPSTETHPTKAHLLEPVNKSNNKDIKIQLPRRENVHIITSTATPVITSWTLTNNKILEPHVINIQPNVPSIKEKNEGKPTHITTNIVQIKTSQNQNVQINNIVKPVLTPTRVSTPYQVIGQMFRPQVSNMQPPTIKIPEPHVLYQKSQGIVISPRMANDPRMQSPKASPQGDGMTSPRLSTIPVLSSSPQNINSTGIVSPNSIHQRSPGQVTVVRVQQPPLSPIQAMHLPPGARTMVSPSRPNSVLVQTQGSPLHHHSRLPVTPVLTPIPKQINVLHQQNKGVGVNNQSLSQQKIITGDVRKNELRNIPENKIDSAKIILSAPTNLQHSTNPTVMAQNRLISMQNAVHIGNINSPLHLNNKFVINKISKNEKRENTHQKVNDHGSHNIVPFVSSPIIHVAGVNHSSPSIIQGSSKPAISNLQEASNIKQGSNVIHTLNSQRLLAPASISNVRHLEMNKVSPSVLTMATIRPSTVLTKLEPSSNITTVTTSNVANVKTPILIKSGSTIGTIRISSKHDKDPKNVPINTLTVKKEIKVEDKIEKEVSSVTDSNILNKQPIFKLKTLQNSTEVIAKCETDFEELLKDNTNKIIVTKDSEKRLEVNVEKTTALIENKQSNDKQQLTTNEYSFLIKEEKVPTSEQASLEFSSIKKKDCIKIEVEDLNTMNNLKDIPKETSSKDNITTPLVKVSTTKDNNATLEKVHQDKNCAPMLSNLFDKAYENVSIDKDTKTSLDFPKLDNTDDLPNESPNISDIIENQLKTLDENDSWSAKDLNIESVIKKVDSLCNDSIETFQTSQESELSENVEKLKPAPEPITETTILEQHSDHLNTDKMDCSTENIANNSNMNSFVNVSTSKRGGRNIRGRKSEKNQDRVQTRQIAKTPRGGGTAAKRGRGRAKVDKKIKNLVTSNTSTIPGDIYDFHEDSGDEGSNKTEPRPRLILTIKSPLSGQAGVIASSTLSIAQKEQNKFEERRPSRDDKLEDFVSPSPNTRKSRRLQEKDVHRSVADDVGEEGARNARSAKRRPIRQAAVGKVANCEKTDKTLPADTRKSPRGTKRTRDRSLSDASIESGDGDGRKDEINRESKTPRLEESVAPLADAEPSPALRTAPSVAVAPALTSNVITSHVTPTPTTPVILHQISSIVPTSAPSIGLPVAVPIASTVVSSTASAIPATTSSAVAAAASTLTTAAATTLSPVAASTSSAVAATTSSVVAASTTSAIVGSTSSAIAASTSSAIAASTSSAIVASTSSSVFASTLSAVAASTLPTVAASILPTVTVSPKVAASSATVLVPPVAQHVILPVVPPVVPPATATVVSLPTPPPAPIPITKPPKKMISEISAKLAGAFEASVQHRPAADAPNEPQLGSARRLGDSVPCAMPAAGAPCEPQLGSARRPGDGAPCAMLPVGATEAAEARVHSPALPHRPPAVQRVRIDRATPIFIRGGEGEASGMGALGAMGALGGMGAGGAQFRALVAGSGGPASLPRGAHHPPPDPPASLPHRLPHHHAHPHPQPHPPHVGAASRITSVPSISPQGQMALGEGLYPHFSQPHFQMYQQHFRATQHERATPSAYTRIEAEGSEAPTSPLELRRLSARVPRPAHSPSPADRHIMYAVKCGRTPPPAHGGLARAAGALAPSAAPGPPHASQVPPEADCLQTLLRRYPVMWQGLLALKTDSAAVQMHFVGGNPDVASETLARAPDMPTPLLRIAQRMRLEPMQLDQVHRKMKLENEHCILLALPCGRDHMDVLQQSTNLTAGFITYLQRKTAAGIVNIAPPGHHQAMFTVHIFPSCDFANENLNRIAPDLMHRVSNIAHLLIVIATV